MGKIKNVFIPNKTPAATTFKVDDLIINAKDGKVFIKTTDNRVICINTSSIEDDDGKRLVTSEVTGSTITTLISNGQGQISGTLGDGTFSVIDIGLEPGDSVTFADVKSTGNITTTGNITATGDVIANRYIVSSSVSHITTSFSSGSTIFGDTVNDTHQFTGSLSVSASTFVVGGASTFNGFATFNSDVISLGENESDRINFNGFSATRFYVKSNITASGNISASGTITAATLDAAAVTDALAAAIVAEIDNDEIPIAKLAEDAVTVTAGTGLTGGGGITLGGSATVNVIGGTGVTANANDIAIGQDVATTANVQFANITSSANISSSGTITAATLDAAAISDTLAAAIVAEIDNDEIPIAKLAEDAVTVTAGTGLTGGGSITLGGSSTVNVIGGDGITANANDMAITAAQTTITSVLAEDLKIGEDAQTKIDFETANEIHFDVNNVELLNLTGAKISGSGVSTGSFGRIDATSLPNIGYANFTGSVGIGTTSPGEKLEVIGNISSSGIITGNSIVGTIGTAAQTNITSVGTLGSLTVTGNITANGNIVGDDGTNITNIAGVQCDLIAADADTTTQIQMGSATIDVLVDDTDVFNVSPTLFTHDIPVKFTSHITSSGNISSSGTIIAATLDAAAVSDTLAAAIVAEIDNDEIPIAKLAEDAVTVTAGTGLTGGGSITLGGSATVNVIGGTGVTANANDIAIGQDVATTANVIFNHITASGNISASGTIIAATLDAAAVSDALAAAIVAEIDNDEIPIAKLAEDAVTVTAGTGLTGGGSITLGGSATVNVIGGDGITANANDMAITATQTTITSILAEDLKIGEDAQTKIDFETANEIHFDVNNVELLNLTGAKISGSGISTGSFGRIDATSLPNIGYANFTGSVGIGTTSPGEKLEVVGNISSSGDIKANTFTAVGNVDFDGDLDVDGTTNLDIVDIDGAVDMASTLTVDGTVDIAGELQHSGDTDTKISFSTNQISLKAGNTSVFESTITGSKLTNIHQNIFDTGSVALSSNSAIGDIVKFGGSSTVAGGIYFLNSAGGWTLTIASAAATSTGSLAVAVGTNSTTHGMCLRGFVNPFTDPSAGIGSPVYLSDTHTGRILAVPPSDTNDVVRIVGYQYGPDLIYFNPSNDYIVHA